MKKCFLVFRALVVCKVNITFSLQNKNILYGVIEIQILKKNYIQILEGKLIMLLQKQSTNWTDLSLLCIWSHNLKILQRKLVLFMLYSLVHCRLSLVASGQPWQLHPLASHKYCEKLKGWPEDKWGQGHWVWAASAAPRGHQRPTDRSFQNDKDTHSLGAVSQLAWTSGHAHKKKLWEYETNNDQVDRNVAKWWTCESKNDTKFSKQMYSL